MNVLQVGTSLHSWGGIERYITYLSSGLEERGHTVTVASPAGSPLAERLPTNAPIQARGKFDLRAIGACTKLIRERKIEIVHAHYSPDFWVAGLAARLGKARVTLATRHIAEPWGKSKAGLYQRLFAHFIPVSDAVQSVLLQSGVPASRMTVALAGCPPLQPTRPRSEVRDGYRMQGTVFGYFGRLNKEKGVEVAIQAATEAGTRLAIFGQGDQEAALRDLGHAAFYGRVEEVDNAMSAVDAVVIPSVWAEAFPFVGLEAMSLAKPILASRIGGLPEMMEDGVTGLFFEPGNRSELAALMQSILNDGDRASQVGAAAQRAHRERFTVAAMAERIEAVYTKLI